jgi:hypothetical protein
MFLDEFYTQENNIIRISAEQGSRFAKEIADDFNPLHDIDNKRFIVPGDFLFSLTLARLGVSSKMTFEFTGMVGKESEISFPETIANKMTITDQVGKSCLEINSSGEITKNQPLIENFIRAYVAFSGHSFPHILVPLMQENNVMINPARPMVMYKTMGFEFESLEIEDISLSLKEAKLNVDGKRGEVILEFTISSNGKSVGKGYKTMMLSGLREYDQQSIDGLVEFYQECKQKYAV